ncbi:MAG: M20/M25/M40 family metallo-hydrolase [Oscillospiraceae bacterium]|nr:M20/M25/M40 family metallo-hydrolase [Oscillospiraceae bacterium]
MEQSRLVETFCRYVRCDSESEKERAFCELVEAELKALGMEVVRDEAAGVASGSDGFNIHGYLPGAGEPILFSAHLDTVPPGCGIEPVVVDGLIRSAGDTVLGADDKAGIAAVVEALARLREQGGTHRPVEVFFTVCEETGLCGAKHADYSLIRSKQAVVLDGAEPGEMINRTPAKGFIHIEITGKSGHAAMVPPKGINAIKVAAAAINEIPTGHIDENTVLNVANLLAPGWSNVVPDKASFDIDLRSFDREVFDGHIARIEAAVKGAAEAVGASYEMQVDVQAEPLFVPPDGALVKRLQAVYEELGVSSKLVQIFGLSDAVWIFHNGIDVINIGLGAQDIHSPDENVSVENLELLTRTLFLLMQPE